MKTPPDDHTPTSDKPNPADELDKLLWRLCYTFSPDTMIRPPEYTTLDIPQAKQAILALIAQSHLDWLDSVLPEKYKVHENDIPTWEEVGLKGFNQAIDTIKANAIKSVGGE